MDSLKTELEREIEKKIRAEAIRLGWLCWKFVSPGLKGVPDRFFARKGRVIFIEVKKLGEPLTLQQGLRAKDLRKAGIECYWVDNLEDALVILAR